MGPRDLKGRRTSYVGLYYKLLSTPPVGVPRDRRRPSVAITAGGSLRDPAPTMSTRVSTATNRASTPGAPQPATPAARTYHAPRPALADREQARCAPAADRGHTPRRASRAYRQSRPAGSAADDHPRTILHARWPSRPSRRCDTRARRRACPLPVCE